MKRVAESIKQIHTICNWNDPKCKYGLVDETGFRIICECLHTVLKTKIYNSWKLSTPSTGFTIILCDKTI